MLFSIVRASLDEPCTVDSSDPHTRMCLANYKCCAYVNDSIYDTGKEHYFCMSEHDYHYNILNDGSYSEDGGITKYYYLECEQTKVL